MNLSTRSLLEMGQSADVCPTIPEGGDNEDLLIFIGVAASSAVRRHFALTKQS